MNNKILYFLIVLVQNTIITTYLDCVFDYKHNRKISNVIIFSFLTLLFLVTTPIINLKPLKLLIITIVQIIFFKLMSHNTLKESLKKTIILVILTLLAELICDPIYMMISYANKTRLDLDTASTFDTLRILAGSLLLPIFICIVLIYCIHYKKIKGPAKNKLIILLLIIPITLIFIHYILYSYNIETFSDTTLLFIFISSVLFTAFAVAVYRLIMQIDTYIKKEKELELLKQKEKMQLEYYKLIQEKELEIGKIKHDIKNNLQVMYALKDENDKKKIIDKIDKSLKKHELIKYSKQDILNTILNLKVNEAKKNKIDIEIEVKSSIDFIEEIDISNLFSNILDNAIENAKESKDKKIRLEIKNKMNYTVIECINSFDGTLIIDNYKNIKSKKKGEHGFGLKIIDSIVNKYNGEKKISSDKNKFKISIFIRKD